MDSLKLSFEATAEILRGLKPGFESGEFMPPIVLTSPLAESPKVRKMCLTLLKERLQHFDTANSHDVVIELRGVTVGINTTHVRNARQSLRKASMIAH